MLYAKKKVTLPLAYNELLQGVIYSCWRDSYPTMHDGGFKASGKTFRLFTFGPLEGVYQVDRKTKTIHLDGTVQFEVRTLFEELIDQIAQKLADDGKVRLGAHTLPLVNLQSNDRLLFPQRAIIQTASPIVVHQTTDDGHTLYYSPDDPKWLHLIQTNTMHKLEALQLAADPTVQIIPLADTLKKHVTQFKGFYVTGWKGQFALSGNPQVISALYHVGLGAKNSQGFGMFNIVDKPL